MKKLLALVLAVAMLVAFAACGKKSGKSEGVMTHAEYDKAAIDDEVVIETYVQGKQSWWDNKATVYTQDEEGGYFLYEMVCSEEDYEKLVPGQKIKVTGYKAEWAGEIEVGSGCTFEIEDGNYIAKPVDVTKDYNDETKLASKQNMLIAVKDVEVAAPALYKWDGSGEDGDDLYLSVYVNGIANTFTVESYLFGKGTDVYEAVKALKAGDKIDVEGFLYWYEGAQPHLTKVTVK